MIYFYCLFLVIGGLLYPPISIAQSGQNSNPYDKQSRPVRVLNIFDQISSVKINSLTQQISNAIKAQLRDYCFEVAIRFVSNREYYEVYSGINTERINNSNPYDSYSFSEVDKIKIKQCVDHAYRMIVTNLNKSE